MSDQENIGAEPPASAVGDEGVPDLSVAQASAVYGISVSTIRRLLSGGRLEGVYTVRGPKGAEHRIPAASLEALGYRSSESALATVRTEQAQAAIANLREELSRLRAELEVSRAAQQAANERAAVLESSLDGMRTAVEHMPEAVEHSRASRVVVRWWPLVLALAVLGAALLLRDRDSGNTGGAASTATSTPVPTPPPATLVTTIAATTTTVPPSTVASTVAPSATTVVPTTVPATTTLATTLATTSTLPPTTLSPRAVAAAQYEAITARANEQVLTVEREQPVNWGSARAICLGLAAAYQGLAADLGGATWPEEVAIPVGAVTALADDLSRYLYACAQATSTDRSLAMLRSRDLRDRFLALTTAATSARVALGLTPLPLGGGYVALA